MRISKPVYSIDSQNSRTFNLANPEQCPLCKAHISGEILYGVYSEKKQHICTFDFCPSCKQLFISQHDYGGNIISSEPQKFIERSFSESFSLLSPMFVKIFNQANAAECSNLDEIAGIGYRKALEFLVKDFCISENLDKQEKIKNMNLSQCIQEYIYNPQIKELSQKCAWLGNDETHYVKKHTDKDLNDLKEFIEALIYFISMHQIYKKSKEITPV